MGTPRSRACPPSINYDKWQGLYDEGDGPLALVVNPAKFKGKHFATFPPKLVEPLVKAGTSEKGCCPKCGKPEERVVDISYTVTDGRGKNEKMLTKEAIDAGQAPGPQGMKYGRAAKNSRTLGWRPGCKCGGEPVPCTVLDPFAGAGTTLLVAAQLGRRGIGIELNPEYCKMAEGRIGKAMRPSTFVDETAAADLPLLKGD